MTATPIPRTLALTLYGDLDVSVLDELPPGRAPRTTELVGPERQRAMWAQLREAVGRGERGFVVCPSIGGACSGASAGRPGPDDEDVEAGHSVAVTLRRVQRALGAGVRVGAVHGRMPTDERDGVLAAFREGALDVLVATVLVEVGLDVPEASFVVLPDASRFGLAQMHQIRGRVGRGGRPGRCLVLLPLPEGAARARAEALVATDDGFRLAEQDLALRGPGELLGTAQSGMPDFIALDPVRDVELLASTRPAAFAAAAGLSDKALAALRARIFPELELRTENLLAGG
jgi:ATP-dependent DNA helicase RecG